MARASISCSACLIDPRASAVAQVSNGTFFMEIAPHLYEPPYWHPTLHRLDYPSSPSSFGGGIVWASLDSLSRMYLSSRAQFEDLPHTTSEEHQTTVHTSNLPPASPKNSEERTNNFPAVSPKNSEERRSGARAFMLQNDHQTISPPAIPVRRFASFSRQSARVVLK